MPRFERLMQMKKCHGYQKTKIIFFDLQILIKPGMQWTVFCLRVK